MRLVEACAGSAALARRLLGAGPLVGYKGGKDGYAQAIIEAWDCPSPDEVHLNEPGLWGFIWPSLIADQKAVGDEIDALSSVPPRQLWDEIRRLVPDQDSPRVAARLLCRIAAAHGGCEFGGFKGQHKLRPNVDGYIPSRRSLAARVRDLRLNVKMGVTRRSATDLEVRDAWVYIDPPYDGTRGYVHGLSRHDVVAVALRLAQRNRVAVSEGVRLSELTERGWLAVELTRGRVGQYRKNTRSHEEWLHISPQPG